MQGAARPVNDVPAWRAYADHHTRNERKNRAFGPMGWAGERGRAAD